MKRVFVFCFTLFVAAAFLLAIPATDARFLKIEITYHLQNDGSWDMEYRHLVRLDTYYAVTRAFGETFIVYNPDFQKLEILKAETTMADGRKVAAPANAFNEVLPNAAHGFADFSGLREMVVTHTGLERGAAIDLHYRIQTKAGFSPVFSGREILAKAFPVDSYRLTIEVPADRVLHTRIFGLKAVAEVSGTEAEKRYVFKLEDLKPDAHETLAGNQAAPFIVFSAASGWEQALATTVDVSALPALMAEKIEAAKAQNPARSDLLAALQKIAAVEVQNCNLGVEATGWRPRPLLRVFQSNYGTRLEKALLLQAMLKKAGIESDLLAIATGIAFAPNVPTPLQMGEFWLKVVDGAGAAFLDPCHEQHEFFPYFPHELDAWNLEVGEMERTLGCTWDRNMVEISGTVQLEPAGASGTLVVAARGIFNRYEEAAADNGKFISGVLKKFFPVDKVEIKKLLQLTRKEIRVEATFNGKWLKDVGNGNFSVDACRLPGLSENMVILDKRDSPLAIEGPFQVSLRLDIEPASVLKFEYAAPDVKRANETGYFSRSLVAGKNGRLRFSETCGIENGIVMPGEYPLLRELFLPYFAPDSWLVFKKGN